MKHIWISNSSPRDAQLTDIKGVRGGAWWDKPFHTINAPRYTLTSGPEWDALMEQVHSLLTDLYRSNSPHRSSLHDLLIYLGEQP